MGLPLRHKIVRRWTRMLMPFRYETENVLRCWCGGSLGPSRSPLVGECVECGTGVLRRRLTEASYERWYASGDYRRCQMGTDGVSAGQILKELRRGAAAFRFMGDMAVGLRSKTVLDVGCGAGGALLAAWLLHGRTVLGVDRDPRSKSIPRAFGIPVQDHLPITVDWDRVLCSHLIEHVIRPVEFLQTLAMCHSPEGCLYVETPAWGPKAEVKLPHPHYFTQDSFLALAKRADLEIVKMEPGLRAVLRRKP